MSYLLDTCVLSELRKRDANDGVVEWVGQIEESGLYLSVLAFAEIQKGVAKLADGSKKGALQAWLEQDLVPRFGTRILGIGIETALTWGLLRGTAERVGRPRPVMDGLIAATAVAHNLTVVTRNTEDFERFPVTVHNPWA
jgi:predicted nucleic acid-binding protein